MISGYPRPAMAGSARLAPASASLRSSGMGLISDFAFIGMKPETMVPAATGTGNARSAIAAAAAARSAASNASRRAMAVARSAAFVWSGLVTSDINISAEPRRPSECDPGNLLL